MNLTKALGSVGGLTLVSRILALVRDTLQASYVGASFASDAFFVAFRLPNMFRALFAEGAFAAAFIPMFNKKVGDRSGNGLPDGIAFAQDVLSVLLPILIVMTVILELFAWPVTLALSGKFNGVTHDQFAFAVTLSFAVASTSRPPTAPVCPILTPGWMLAVGPPAALAIATPTPAVTCEIDPPIASASSERFDVASTVTCEAVMT